VSGTTFIVSGGVANDIAFTVNNSTLRFGDASSLGSATVAVSNNGALRLAETASSGTAAVTVSSGAFGIDTLTGAGTTVGSIAGDANGTISLGTKTLTVGGNNQSTLFAGRILGTSGSLVKEALGADLAAAIGNVDLGLRLGWLHEYASTARPISAAFAGAPSASFTVYGATPQRDAAVIGFQASANVVAATQLYLRYDGEIAAGSDNHTLNVGLRLSW
jgi:hypothetical protein